MYMRTGIGGAAELGIDRSERRLRLLHHVLVGHGGRRVGHQQASASGASS